jgi:hypothetical protein
MINRQAVIKATAIGTVAQVLMVMAGHQNPNISKLFAVLGMTISLLAGLRYSRIARGGPMVSGLVGGLLAGGICALIGIAISYYLGDVPANILLLGTASSAVTGAIGGGIGQVFYGKKGGATSAA